MRLDVTRRVILLRLGAVAGLSSGVCTRTLASTPGMSIPRVRRV